MDYNEEKVIDKSRPTVSVFNLKKEVQRSSRFEKIKEFQEKEQTLLKKSFSQHSKNGLTSEDQIERDQSLTNQEKKIFFDAFGLSTNMKNHVNNDDDINDDDDSIPGYFVTSNSYNNSSDTPYLSLPTNRNSSFKKKSKSFYSTKKQKVKFDPDVEVHVVPRDCYQSSPVDSIETGQSDPEFDLLYGKEIELDDEDEREITNSLFCAKEAFENYPPYTLNSQNKALYETDSFEKLSLTASNGPFRVISREGSGSGKNTVVGSSVALSGRKDSIDLFQMQQFMKHQAKERALSASLPLIRKRTSRNSLKLSDEKFVSPFRIEKKPSSANGFSLNSTTSKRYLNNFNLYRNREVSTFALVQLQKQYNKWEERRRRKKNATERNQATVTLAQEIIPCTFSENTGPSAPAFSSSVVRKSHSHNSNNYRTIFSQQKPRTNSRRIDDKSCRKQNEWNNDNLFNMNKNLHYNKNFIDSKGLAATLASTSVKNKEKPLINAQVLNSTSALLNSRKSFLPASREEFTTISTLSDTQRLKQTDAVRSNSAATFHQPRKIIFTRNSTPSAITLRTLGLTVNPPRSLIKKENFSTKGQDIESLLRSDHNRFLNYSKVESWTS